jgi:hypothetical protein
MVNYNPMSKDFQDAAKSRGMSGFQYMQLLKQRPVGINKVGNCEISSYQTYPKSPGQIKSMFMGKY